MRLRQLWHTLSSVAELDLRSLALMRISLGMLIVSDLVVALTNAECFYSDAGVLPLKLLRERAWHDDMAWSLHSLNGSVAWVSILIAIGILAAIALTMGWKTRWATAISWLLWCSLETRNPLVINGVDPVVRMLLFWCLFIP